MVQFCVMVKGPCRGRKCDFWARVKIRKSSTEDLVKGLRDSITRDPAKVGSGLNEAFEGYWSLLGVKDRSRLCREEPDLCEKMRTAEEMASLRLVSARH